MSKRGLIWLIGILSVLLFSTIVFCFVPIKQVSYTATESYQATETYYEKEPFTTYETYTEREPYSKSVPIDYLVTNTEGYDYFWSAGFDARVWIKNTDLKSGTFTVDYYLTLEGGAQTTKSASKYIAISETEKVEVSYSGAYLASWTYSVTPPTKTITDYRDVEKTREVVEYRDVSKQRTVWKERPVTRYKYVSMLEYLTSY